MTFVDKLRKVLGRDARFVDADGELVLAALQDCAWKGDRGLIELLIGDYDISRKFFDEIGGRLVFKASVFLKYVQDQGFIDHSYTRFRNHIGLAIGDQFLRNESSVALIWPYKDTVLEGGQTKEEEGREEIFFNEVLAEDEINRLLDPKVLTSAVRHTSKGASPLKELRRTSNGVLKDNLIFRGNNLIALHLLSSQMKARVKLIYIDPPYNTENDSFRYNDRFRHSTWLTFMKNRIEAAWQLLGPTGMMFIQCDDTESAYLRVVMDELVGRNNFVTQINWQRAPEGRTVLGQGSTFITNSTEYILVYAKDINKVPPTCPIRKRVDATEKALGQYNHFFASPGHRVAHKTLKDARGNEIKIFKHSGYSLKRIPAETPTADRLARFNELVRIAAQQEESTLQQKILSAIEPSHLFSVEYSPTTGKRKGQPVVLYYFGGGILLQLKNYAETDGERVFRIAAMNNFWSNEEIQVTGIADEGGVELRRGKKPEELIRRIIEMVTEPGDIVLDYHLGSGTTCAVAHKLGRQYIGIEQLDYGENDCTERLRNVVNGDQSGVSRSVNWGGGGEFVVFELMKYNEAFLEDIGAARTSSDLLKIWKRMSEGSFLKWYVNPSSPEEAHKAFESLGKEKDGVKKQKHLLAELLDKNQLYVNLSEIDDARFKVSPEIKKINRLFYGEAYDA